MISCSSPTTPSCAWSRSSASTRGRDGASAANRRCCAMGSTEPVRIARARRRGARLQRPDGNRGPRYYWELARGHFREEVLAQQTPTEVCPFWRDYQLMRNYLFAAECARQAEKAYFGVIGMAPSARSKPLASGVERFQDSLLLPANAARIAFVSYESYVDLLASGSAEARELAAFLRALLA